MKYIVHRVNNSSLLKQIPKEYGVELDLRDYENELVLQHDPFKSGEKFEKYLECYNHSFMILNIKSEGIETRVSGLLKKYNIKKYFFLDSSIPMIIKLIKNGEKNIAVRFSEYEKINTVLSFSGKVNWVWVDCFEKIPLDNKTFQKFKEKKFKLCFVSPDLQNQKEKISAYKKQLEESQIFFDAICVKYSNLNFWKTN